MFDISIYCGTNAITRTLLLKTFEKVTEFTKKKFVMCLTYRLEFEKGKNNLITANPPFIIFPYWAELT